MSVKRNSNPSLLKLPWSQFTKPKPIVREISQLFQYQNHRAPTSDYRLFSTNQMLKYQIDNVAYLDSKNGAWAGPESQVRTMVITLDRHRPSCFCKKFVQSCWTSDHV